MNTEQTKQSNRLSWIRGRGEDTGQITIPKLERQTGEYRESHLPGAETQAETAMGTSARVGKSEL